jgi:hypothetical protein
MTEAGHGSARLGMVRKRADGLLTFSAPLMTDSLRRGYFSMFDTRYLISPSHATNV